MNKKFEFYSIKLSAFIVCIFVVQTLFQNFTDLFSLSQSSWTQPWRFLTAIFLHGSSTHLVLNLFALILFGSILEKFVGEKKLLIIFFSTGILANLISVNFYNNSLGASGAIFGIIGALIFIRPLLIIWAFGMPMPIFIAGILWVASDVLGVFGFGQSGVGNLAHLSGIIFGLLFGSIYKKKKKKPIKKNKISIDEQSIRQWENEFMKN